MTQQMQRSLWLLLLMLMLAACGGTAEETHSDEPIELELPALQAVARDGRSLRVVATTSVIGDVLRAVAGDAIELTTLMGPGDDPHAFQATPGNLRDVEQADVIFVNGWDLEAGLLSGLESIASARIVPISAGFTPRLLSAAGEDDHAHEEEHTDEAHDADEHAHAHGAADPHVWFSVAAVRQWAANAADVLSALDPANAGAFAANRDAYLTQLDALQAYMDAQFATIPAAQRKLVTNHDSFGYLAAAYDFEVIGTVIPSVSTAADPSAAGLADLVTRMRNEAVCTLFTETTASTRLAETVAAELDNCAAVAVVQLYTGSVGPLGSGAESYIGMMRSNTDAIVGALTR